MRLYHDLRHTDMSNGAPQLLLLLEQSIRPMILTPSCLPCGRWCDTWLVGLLMVDTTNQAFGGFRSSHTVAAALGRLHKGCHQGDSAQSNGIMEVKSNVGFSWAATRFSRGELISCKVV